DVAGGDDAADVRGDRPFRRDQFQLGRTGIRTGSRAVAQDGFGDVEGLVAAMVVEDPAPAGHTLGAGEDVPTVDDVLCPGDLGRCRQTAGGDDDDVPAAGGQLVGFGGGQQSDGDTQPGELLRA